MHRRDLLKGALLLPVGTPLLASAADPPGAPPAQPFDAGHVRALARELAGKPYKAPDRKLPDAYARLGYDDYRKLRFVPARAIWRGRGLPFEVQLFHRGFLYPDRVEIFEVADGQAMPLRYAPELFEYGDLPPPPPGEDLGFAGFRVHFALNRPDYLDEVCAFLGASYFRAVAKGQGYGLSARGLAIRTADRGGEEFPSFRSFWLERPQPRSGSLVIHALLDGPSCAGAFRFTLRPGEETVFDVESALYPRVDMDQAGLAPMTSMFYFGPASHARVDDWRPAVHDSDGLSIWSGWSEQLWRPLANPGELQISAFSDVNPRGFGLLQRRRDFAAYDDLEARYEKRPSLWAEPIGDIGDGKVMLVEIPTTREIHDNIVAFWRPLQPLKAKGEHVLNYRLHWGWDRPGLGDLARAVATRSGAGGAEKTRIFVVDFAGERLKKLPPDLRLRAEVGAQPGRIANVVTQPNPEIDGGWRLSFELTPENGPVAELRARLLAGDEAVSEIWLFRWTA